MNLVLSGKKDASKKHSDEYLIWYGLNTIMEIVCGAHGEGRRSPVTSQPEAPKERVVKEMVAKEKVAKEKGKGSLVPHASIDVVTHKHVSISQSVHILQFD